MKIQVKQLGAVKDITVDLSKKLNIFCGKNSTGKTYMAYIIYAITSLENKSFGINLSDDIIDLLIKNNSVLLRLNFNEIYKYKINENNKIKSNLWRLFSIPESKSEDFFSKTEINYLENKDEFINRIKNIKFNENIKFHDYIIQVIKTEDNYIQISLTEEVIKNESFIRYLEIAFLPILYSKLVYYPIMSSTIFPVERNSVFTFNKELSIKKNEKYDLIKELSSNKDFNPLDLIFKTSNRYPQPIRDILKIADDLETIKKSNSVYYDFAVELEKELLEGTVIIGKEGNVEFLSDRTSKNKVLSFHQSSSIVKTLAGLVIYLKHTATKNDLVIIDEPELNLHPDNQIKLARIFSRLMNKGLNLIISTHSDYILREFNNLIMLSSDSKRISIIKDKYGYKDDEFVRQDEIGVNYFFYKSKRNSDVKNIEIKDYGFNIPSIDDEIELQNDINDDLYYSLKFD